MVETTVKSPTEETDVAADARRDRRDEQCPECGGDLLNDESRGETVCEGCGLVVEEGAIDHGPEWRAYDSEEREERTRVGSPRTELLHDKGLSSTIGWQNRDASGRSLSSRQREKMKRLRKWDERYRTRDSQERNLKQALGEIKRMSSALGLSEDVRETASVIYRKALDADLLPGRSIEGVSTAALYAAVRMAQVPRTIDEIAAVSRIDPTEFKRTYRYVDRELGLPIEPADPENYVARFAGDLDLSSQAERSAHRLLEAAKEQHVHSGRSPVGLAASAVYAATLLCNERVTQAEVSEVAEISKVTIRSRYTELLEAANATRPDAD